MLSLLGTSLLTGCGTGSGTDVEALSRDPEALKEAHRKCRLKVEGADEQYCRAVAEAERKRFFRADEKTSRQDAAPEAPPTKDVAQSKP